MKVKVDGVKKTKWGVMCIGSLWYKNLWRIKVSKLSGHIFEGKKPLLGLLNTTVVNCEGCGIPPILWNSNSPVWGELNYCYSLSFSHYLLSCILQCKKESWIDGPIHFPWPGNAILSSYFSFMIHCMYCM